MSPDWSAKEEPIPYAKLDDPQSLNLYAYMMNNPLAGVDSDGHGSNGIPDWASNILMKGLFLGYVLAKRIDDAAQPTLNAVNNFVSDALNPTKNCPNCQIGIVFPEGAAGQALKSSEASILENAAKGAEAEKATLSAEGLAKNTEKFTAIDPKTGQAGATIPDAVRESGQTVDVKNVQNLSDSKQLRLQSQVSAQNGQKAQVISTNPNAKISSTVKQRMDVKTPNQ
jgi:hypothetical protein